VVPDPCLTNITPVSPAFIFVIDKVLFAPNVTLAFEPLFKFQSILGEASVKTC